MDGEALRQVDLAARDPVDRLARDRGVQVVDDLLRALGVHRRRAGGLPGALEDLLQLLLVVLQRLLGLLDGDVAAADEVLGVDLAHRALLVDRVVHQRLRERRLVDLAVAAAAVADHVDDDVLLERLPVVEGELRDADARLGVVAVHVEDRRLHHARDVGRVDRRARGVRAGGEADLVVDDDVHGAAGAVAAQLRHLQRLGDDALAGEGRVAVQQDRQDGEAVLALVDDVLLGAHDALEDRVDGLEVRRVGLQADRDRVAGQARERALGAEVVLHVARAVRGARVDVALELAEDLRVALADDVGEHVEAAAVRHADRDLVEALLGRALQDAVEQRDERLAALEREALLARRTWSAGRTRTPRRR